MPIEHHPFVTLAGAAACSCGWRGERLPDSTSSAQRARAHAERASRTCPRHGHVGPADRCPYCSSSLGESHAA